MKKKYEIEVRTPEGKPLKKIKRVLRAESIGNFNPIFCTYKNKKYLVLSDAGDISDPFRRDETYLETLYIQEETPCTQSK